MNTTVVCYGWVFFVSIWNCFSNCFDQFLSRSAADGPRGTIGALHVWCDVQSSDDQSSKGTALSRKKGRALAMAHLLGWHWGITSIGNRFVSIWSQIWKFFTRYSSFLLVTRVSSQELSLKLIGFSKNHLIFSVYNKHTSNAKQCVRTNRLLNQSLEKTFWKTHCELRSQYRTHSDTSHRWSQTYFLYTFVFRHLFPKKR